MTGRALRANTFGSAAGNGPPRIANPLAPRSGVQLAAGEAGHLEAEQIMTGGDAGAAHGDEILEAAAPETFLPVTLEFGGGQETTVRAEIGGKREISGARDIFLPPIGWVHPAP